jgi:hypothetical protein
VETLRSITIVHPPLGTRMNVLWLIAVLMSCLLFAPATLAVSDSATRPADHRSFDTDFALTIHDGCISLTANDASLKGTH